MPARVNVGGLKRFLSNFSPEAEITFGSSKYRKRPLIFYRFKCRGEDLLQIELNEIDENFDPTSEIDCRPTVQEFLRYLDGWPDDAEVTFGCSLDAVPFEFRDISQVVAINLEQTEEPKWEVHDGCYIVPKE